MPRCSQGNQTGDDPEPTAHRHQRLRPLNNQLDLQTLPCNLSESEDEIRQHVVLEHLQDFFRVGAPGEDLRAPSATTIPPIDRVHTSPCKCLIRLVEEEDLRVYPRVPRPSPRHRRSSDVAAARVSSPRTRSRISSPVQPKARFTSIPKRQGVYSCGKCSQKLSRRYHLIQHLVQAHVYISQQEIESTLPAAATGRIQPVQRRTAGTTILPTSTTASYRPTSVRLTS